ncbi:MAG: universal stress protein [Vicingaceae bacterium]
MNTILIPTDFSENALMAVDFTVEKLMQEETKLALVNVYNIPHGGTSGLFYLLDELQKQSKKDMEDFCEKLKARFPNHDLKIETHIAQGDFSEQCKILASELDADCLVMGTKGASGVKEVLIGSSTVDMMRSLNRPLYVIPENYREKGINEMIISYDGLEYPEKAAGPIRYFAKRHNLPLRALHVRIDEDAPLQNWEQFKKLFEGFTIDLHESHGDDYESGLKKGIKDSKALLVLLRHKQTFWERFFNRSDSRKAVMHANLPVLVIPE